MDEQKRSVAPRTSWRRTFRSGGLALCAVLFVAAPALADRDFERGYKDEMGRILAHETVAVAKAVFVHTAPLPVVHVHRPVVVHRAMVYRAPVRWVHSGPPRWAKAHGHRNHRFDRHDRYDRHDCDDRGHRQHDGRRHR